MMGRLTLVGVLVTVGAVLTGAATLGQDEREPGAVEPGAGVGYLEIVTPSVDETCAALASVHGVEFGEPVAMLGNARTASLDGGGRIGVRAPLRDTEKPVVRPYLLVDDIAAAVRAAEAAGRRSRSRRPNSRARARSRSTCSAASITGSGSADRPAEPSQ